jgi:hypothetical protein
VTILSLYYHPLLIIYLYWCMNDDCGLDDVII